MAGEDRVIGVVAACPFPIRQGSQVLIHHLSSALSRRGFPVHIVTYAIGDYPSEPGYSLHRTAAFIPYRKRDPGPSIVKPLIDFLLLVKTISTGKREKFDILHGHNYEGALVGWVAARWLGIPLIYFRHSRLSDEFPFYFKGRLLGWLARRIGSLIDRIADSLPDHIITVSPEEPRDRLKWSRSPHKTTFVPPGIDPEEWREPIPERPEEDKRPTLIYTGNLAPFQHIAHLLEVIRIVRTEFPMVRLRVVTPSDPKRLRERASAMGLEGHLSIHAERDFPATVRLLRLADLACSFRTMASGFPIKHLNYMAAGLPIVCYRSGAKGVVDGETGIVVNDGDIPAFGQAVAGLLRDDSLRREMGRRAREAVFRDYRWDNLVVSIEEIHDRLLPDSSRRGSAAPVESKALTRDPPQP